MYSPLIGRFAERDPLDYAAGDDNLYRSVRDNPESATDPTGLWNKKFHEEMTREVAQSLGVTCWKELGQEAYSPDETSSPIKTNLRNLILGTLTNIAGITKVLNDAANEAGHTGIQLVNAPRNIVEFINKRLPGGWPDDAKLHLPSFEETIEGINAALPDLWPDWAKWHPGRPDQGLPISVDVLKGLRTKMAETATRALQTMMDYHFPGAAESGQVTAGGDAAWDMVYKGIGTLDPTRRKLTKTNCDFQLFAHGLHSLQDSFSHEGRQFLDPQWTKWLGLGQVLGGGHNAGTIEYTDYLATFKRLLTTGKFDVVSAKQQVTGLLAFLSTSVDDPTMNPVAAAGAADATFAAMIEFVNRCGRCPCPTPQGKQRVTNGPLPLDEKTVTAAWTNLRNYMLLNHKIPMDQFLAARNKYANQRLTPPTMRWGPKP